ncbi:RNA polymerase III C11 subunit [Dimargaris xerosporica]|nr:RNA polymerase III C11 subunit [Dimargaris xerosporica]
MLFCPSCSNLLINKQAGDGNAFQCQTCPYMFPIVQRISSRTVLKTKQVDDVLGGAEAWASADKTQIRCEKCSHDFAYFRLIQIRSADEPSTQFFRCCNEQCQHEWREG